MKFKHLTISALALILMTACSDSTGLESSDLVGTWTATSMIFTSVEDPVASVDLVAVEGAILTLSLGEDDTYTWVLTIPGVPEENEHEAGTYVVTGSTVTLSETDTGSPEPFTIVRNGDTLTLTDTNEEFDFTQLKEPAVLVITLTR